MFFRQVVSFIFSKKSSPNVLSFYTFNMVLWSNMKKCLLSLIVFLGICSPVPAMAETPESIDLDTSFRENILALVEQSEEKKDSRGFLPDFRIDDNTLKEEVDDTHYPDLPPRQPDGDGTSEQCPWGNYFRGS